MTLNTWGNGTYTIPVTCRGSLATGFTQYGSIIYAYVFSFGPTLPIPG